MSVFSTDRPQSVSEMRAAQEQMAAERRANRQLMEAQRLLEQQEAQIQEDLAKKDKEQKEQEERAQAMEATIQRRNMERSNIAILEATTKLPQTGRDAIIKHALFGIALESMWVDKSVTESPDFIPKTYQLFEETLAKCDAATGTTISAQMENTKLLSYINDVATTYGASIADRILTEAKETNSIEINFDPTKEEQEEINQKIVDADAKGIAQAIKKKVLDVVKDEKDAGKVKADIFKELDEAGKDEESGGDDVTESLVGLTMEATIDTLNIKDPDTSDFTHSIDKISSLIAVSDKEAINKNFEKVAQCSEEVIRVTGDVKAMWHYQNRADQEAATQKLLTAFNDRMFNIRPGTGKACVSEGTTKLSCDSASANTRLLPAIENYCKSMKKAVSENNIVTETVEQIRDRLTRERVGRAINSTIGSSLFESCMIKNMNDVRGALLESDNKMLQADVQNAALLQTVVEYTMFETLNTMKVYPFTDAVVAKIKAM